jgi:hypothetical protein
MTYGGTPIGASSGKSAAGTEDTLIPPPRVLQACGTIAGSEPGFSILPKLSRPALELSRFYVESVAQGPPVTGVPDGAKY